MDEWEDDGDFSDMGSFIDDGQDVENDVSFYHARMMTPQPSHHDSGGSFNSDGSDSSHDVSLQLNDDYGEYAAGV